MIRRLRFELRDGWRRLLCACFGCVLKIWHPDRRQWKCLRCGVIYTEFTLVD